MPDPISRALGQAALSWGPSAPALLRDSIVAVAQFGILLAVVLVVAGAWGAGGRTPVGLVLALAPGVLAAALAYLTIHVIGLVAPVERPFVALGGTPLFVHAPDASFPSDHVTLGMSMLGSHIKDRRIQVAVALVVLLVGLARVAAGVHWLDDIVGGALIGLAFAWIGRTIWVAVLGRRRAGFEV